MGKPITGQTMLIKFLDIETTHLNEQIGEIIEVAIVTSMDGGKTFCETWQIKIKPETNAHARKIEIFAMLGARA